MDIAVSGLWEFMWFVAFCFTADQLRKRNGPALSTPARNCANSGVAFSFFSLFAWVSLQVYF